MKMHMITNAEWNCLADLTDGDDTIMHWGAMYSLVADVEDQYLLGPRRCAIRGNLSARHWNRDNIATRSRDIGFRPTIEDPGPSILPPNIPDGSIVVIGALFMGGKPVRIPQKPTREGDITDYVPGAVLRIKAPLDDPAYMVTGIKHGSRVYVDRCLLRNISQKDIKIKD